MHCTYDCLRCPLIGRGDTVPTLGVAQLGLGSAQETGRSSLRSGSSELDPDASEDEIERLESLVGDPTCCGHEINFQFVMPITGVQMHRCRIDV